MKKILLCSIGFFAVLALVAYIANTKMAGFAEAATHDVTLDVEVQTALTFDFTSGDAVDFGDLTPGTPIPAPSGGSIASVTTNAANGYTIGVHDGSATNSALVHTDTTTYIADYAGTIATPTAWTGTGVGITLFAGDHAPDAKWCASEATCSTYDDSDNYYAGVPLAATTAHTVTGYHATADTSSWAFKIDVPAIQKTGAYHGHVTFTATGVLS
jgi:hypothetical protein